MKKFLTVLLALSVIFTYSFSAVGTAFAADELDKATVLQQAEKEASEQFSKIETYAKEWRESLTYNDATAFDKELGYKFTEIDGKYFTASDVEKLCKLVNEEAKAALDKEVTKIVSGTYASQDELTAALGALKTIAKEYDDGHYADKVKALDSLAKLELTYAQERYTAYVESVNELDYSDVPNTDGVIIRDQVKKLKEQAKLDIANATAPYAGDTSARAIANKLYTTLQDKSKYPTIKDEEGAIQDLDDAIAYYTAKIEAEILAQKAQVKYDLNEKLKEAKRASKVDAVLVAKLEDAIASVDDNFAKVTTTAKAVISLQKTTADVKNKYNAYSTQAKDFTVSNIYDSDYQLKGNFKEFVRRADTAAALETKAAEMKTKTGFDGTPLYDSAAIDEALEKDLALVYTGETAIYLDKVAPSEDLVKAEMNRVLYGDNVIVNKIKYPTVSTWAVESKYDEVGTYDEVKAIVKETVNAVRSAKTVADVDAAFLAGYEKFDAVISDADKDTYQKTVAGSAAVAKYQAKLEAELVGKKADYGNTKFAEDFDITDATFITNLVNKYLKVAYSDADLETKYQAAVKEITELKNKAELKTEAAAINAAIADLSKKTLTAADEEEVLALVEREGNLKEYVKFIGATGSYITYGTDTYKTKMQSLVKAEMDAAKKAIGTVTVEDADAIADLVAKAEAYKENYGATYDLGTLEADLLKSQIKAVEKAIGDINADADPLDVDAIKAAREAYDALGENTIDSTMYHKLLSLENLSKDYIIKAVESLKITASSVAAKGSITVKWKVDGDYSAADGMRVYKSTKKNSGYGATPYFITKKGATQYKNTKELKKGTRYYYKVRAYVEIDGVKYYSDWSNKAYRIAK